MVPCSTDFCNIVEHWQLLKYGAMVYSMHIINASTMIDADDHDVQAARMINT